MYNRANCKWQTKARSGRNKLCGMRKDCWPLTPSWNLSSHTRRCGKAGKILTSFRFSPCAKWAPNVCNLEKNANNRISLSKLKAATGGTTCAILRALRLNAARSTLMPSRQRKTQPTTSKPHQSMIWWNTPKARLTKSDFMDFLACPEAFWLQRHKADKYYVEGAD